MNTTSNDGDIRALRRQQEKSYATARNNCSNRYKNELSQTQKCQLITYKLKEDMQSFNTYALTQCGFTNEHNQLQFLWNYVLKEKSPSPIPRNESNSPRNTIKPTNSNSNSPKNTNNRSNPFSQPIQHQDAITRQRLENKYNNELCMTQRSTLIHYKMNLKQNDFNQFAINQCGFENNAVHLEYLWYYVLNPYSNCNQGLQSDNTDNSTINTMSTITSNITMSVPTQANTTNVPNKNAFGPSPPSSITPMTPITSIPTISETKPITIVQNNENENGVLDLENMAPSERQKLLQRITANITLQQISNAVKEMSSNSGLNFHSNPNLLQSNSNSLEMSTQPRNWNHHMLSSQSPSIQEMGNINVNNRSSRSNSINSINSIHSIPNINTNTNTISNLGDNPELKLLQLSAKWKHMMSHNGNDNNSTSSNSTPNHNQAIKKGKRRGRKKKSLQNPAQNDTNTNNSSILHPTMNTVNIDANELENMPWRQKALNIIQHIINEPNSEPFRRKVDEIRDEAHGYYKIITQPMDLGTLRNYVNNKTIANPTKFVTNLMQIWTNAQKYNSAPSHHIHRVSKKLQTLSNKLVRLYWPKEYKNLYESKRKSTRKMRKRVAFVKYSDDTNNAIRVSLNCTECSNELQLNVGYHINCKSLNKEVGQTDDNISMDDNDNDNNKSKEDVEDDSDIICDECDGQISGFFYHCRHGCDIQKEGKSSKSNHKGPKYHEVHVCSLCAEKHYDSRNLVNNKDGSLAFYGLFLDLSPQSNGNAKNQIWYEAIIVYQDANRIFYDLVCSSENDKKGVTEGRIIDYETKQFEVINGSVDTVFTRGALSDDGEKIVFIDEDDPEDEDQMTLTKKQPICKNCNKKMSFFFEGYVTIN